uniref:Uncharacterized protein n=1 Tax=Ananas comosus var. bracteatus TaxID=296719 RepID=A0A6V7PBP3_ANACO|nr:unnamed protein product [Ananas comosus var. bracteatus]
MDAASSSTGAEGYGNTTRNGGIFSFLSSGFLISPSGDKVDLKEMQGKSVGLYFAANWYWKCETFTPFCTRCTINSKKKAPDSRSCSCLLTRIRRHSIGSTAQCHGSPYRLPISVLGDT